MSNILKGLNLDHFLVEHTPATTGVIAEAVNQARYNTIYIELYGNPDEQAYNQEKLQAIVDKKLVLVEEELPEEAATWIAFGRFNQTGARVVAIDKKFSDYYTTGFPPEDREPTVEDFIEFIYRRAQLSQLREPIMAEQVRADWIANGRTFEKCALITGRQHVFPSIQLARQGAKTKRFILEGVVSPILDGRYFDDVTAAVRAIRYGTRSDEEIKEWLTNFWDSLE